MTYNRKPSVSPARKVAIIVGGVVATLAVIVGIVMIVRGANFPSGVVAGIGPVAALVATAVAAYIPSGAGVNRYGIAKRDKSVWVGIALGIAGTGLALAAYATEVWR